MRRVLVCVLFAALAACSAQPAPSTRPTSESMPTTPPPKPDEVTPPSPALMSPEECTSQGGKVKGDIGDGKVACSEGERELGKVKTGIEGGVCCAAP